MTLSRRRRASSPGRELTNGSRGSFKATAVARLTFRGSETKSGASGKSTSAPRSFSAVRELRSPAGLDECVIPSDDRVASDQEELQAALFGGAAQLVEDGHRRSRGLILARRPAAFNPEWVGYCCGAS